MLSVAAALEVWLSPPLVWLVLVTGLAVTFPPALLEGVLSVIPLSDAVGKLTKLERLVGRPVIVGRPVMRTGVDEESRGVGVLGGGMESAADDGTRTSCDEGTTGKGSPQEDC